MKGKYYPIFFIIIFLSPLIVVWLFGGGAQWVGVTIALLVGIGAIMQPQVNRYFFMPLLDITVKEVPTITVSGQPVKYYSLIIKNSGFSPAKNVKVKIRDGVNKSWINLQRPFTSFLSIHDKLKTYINNLSVGEEEDFNIGCIAPNDVFELMEDIRPTNQKTKLNRGEEQEYFLEIVVDNASPHSFRMKIKNDGYGEFNSSNILILAK